MKVKCANITKITLKDRYIMEIEAIFSSISYKDPLWIAVAFLFGALSRAVGLPPLVGFLVAGFVLNALGVAGGYFLNEMADLGVALLLFSIGLKLKIKNLLKVEIWGTALAHMGIFIVFTSATLLFLKSTGLSLFAELTLIQMILISFALSFSSTVFVVKVLDEQGNFLSRFGQMSIGILIIQDIVAVLYLGASIAKIPSVWAIVLIAAILISRPLLIKLSTSAGHGELLLLFGLVMALGGSALFEWVDMKGDLGSLFLGILLANTAKSEELANSLFSIKELFLVGFFLSIGMTGLPNLDTLIIVPILLTLIFFKSALFFFILSFFKSRTAPAVKASIILGNYSEFGLIVTIVGVSQGWISNEWLIVIAMLVSTSFVISSALNSRSDDIYNNFRERLKKFQHKSLLKEENEINIKGVKILICGMGRVGGGAYDYLAKENNVIGLDFDNDVIKKQRKKHRKTYYANVSGSDFWSQIDIKNTTVEHIMLCTPNVDTNMHAASLAREWGFTGKISATAIYNDEKDGLLESGVDTVFDIYAEAGAGFALHGKEESKS